MEKKLTVLDLFSGIGGFSLGLERTGGFKTIAFCEIDLFCWRVLAKHWPDVPIYEDIRNLSCERGSADIITGGFPCQDVSLAGKRAGVSGARTGLYREMVRAIRLVRPRYALMENVAALLGNGMGAVLGDVAEDGYDAEWDCISASDVGAPHGRDRVWIALADAYQFQRETRRHSPTGWWLWGKTKAEAACNPDRPWKLQPPRLLGNIRRWVDNATSSRAWWQGDWQSQFEAFRGMDDGAPSGLEPDSIRALGNAVVPQIPEIIGRAILKAEGLA